MKIAFLSDIHGNAVALDYVISHIEKLYVDQIYVLGDLCYRGPEPKRALQLIQDLNAKVLKGNADEWVVRGVRKGEVPDKALEMMNKERDWTLTHLNDKDVDYLKNLPSDFKITTRNGKTIHAFHATPTSLFDVVLPDKNTTEIEESLMSNTDADLYVYAHIHLPYVRYMNGKCVANLGSVGLPFDGQPLASFLVVEETDDQLKVTIERVRYDVVKVMKQYEDVNYPNLELMKKVVQKGLGPFQV
ncbi:YfcE family phosphodiesterase [Anaerobacillus alkalilacustris]|uniref:YfcE family phosphodiesterase n=1 Tax=Anaerobacillus alkalilacustris TaxID=393763 RepID=A0A1S2LE58_9BACI|nr:metallophosphoesterase family protein [Anaerobacillus alkalilacustris]OIJ10802.1 YfcE family phosphodiesterase [Anaerobacillus alkalilacustris]